MNSPDKLFRRRADLIPFQGTGLSVDLHVPDLFELIGRLEQSNLPFDYLELFRGPFNHLKPVRDTFPSSFQLAYHADSLWFTLPEFGSSPWEIECEKILRDTNLLGSAWITHECAAKQAGGISFGTYFPPLLTDQSARVAGEQARMIQSYIDARWNRTGIPPPLLVVETPPFYGFVVGDLPLSRFFREISLHSPCGFLLDIGHLYTYYLASGSERIRAPEEFLIAFLDEFPLERVVQIHLAGVKRLTYGYFDDHGSPVPEILYAFLEILLNDDRMTSLKGIAFEADTKEISLIIPEYERFLRIGGESMGLRGR